MLLNQMFEIKYPVIQGAMANIATAEFAASVSNAGGMGVIGTGAMNVEQAREAIRKCRSLTDKPFGVNVMMMNPYTKELMEMIAEEKVALVTTGAGNPGVYMKMLNAFFDEIQKLGVHPIFHIADSNVCVGAFSGIQDFHGQLWIPYPAAD